jgi:N-acyl-phosphatidylethanolamine-hydrolysing phospholipase D
VAATITLPPAAPLPETPGTQGHATWIGRSTFLLRTGELTYLTDPVFSRRAGPMGWFGPRRVHPPGIALEQLPPIDVVLLSHDHYDHWDAPTLRVLARRHDPLFVAPLRHADLLRHVGARRTVELDWWQTHAMAGAHIALTPAQHSEQPNRPAAQPPALGRLLYRCYNGGTHFLVRRRLWLPRSDVRRDSQALRAA